MKKHVFNFLLISAMIGLMGCGKTSDEEIKQEESNLIENVIVNESKQEEYSENERDVLIKDTEVLAGLGTPISEQTFEATTNDWDYLNSTDEPSGTYEQLLVIAENSQMWATEDDYLYDAYQYAVTDLDHNGRYEVIVSNMGGTGMYTYSRFFEINESYDGLAECATDYTEFDSQPDIMSGKLETYIDDRGEFHYAVYDLIKNGAAEYYENVQELTLRDGKISSNYLAYKTTIYEGEAPTVTCTDSEGNVITEDEYASVVSNYFAGYQKATTSLGWQDVRELKKDTSEIAAQLDMSLNVFLYSE